MSNITPIPLSQSGGTTGSVSGFSVSTQSIPSVPSKFSQVVGLVPLTNCDYQDCRESQQRGCFYNPVFGEVISGIPTNDPTYENDFNTFLIDFPSTIAGTFVSIVLEKNNDPFFSGSLAWEWQDLAYINNNSCGIYYPLGSITPHPTYMGYAINWAKVLNLYGPGFYRISFRYTKIINVITVVNGTVILTPGISVEECTASEPFLLRAWDCNLAHGTVKFETWETGTQGSETEYEKLYDLCDILWYDSIRFKGFFGYKTRPRYEEILNEFNTGVLESVRVKLYKRQKLVTNYLPQWLHDRFASYGLMADTILVSDYNKNNSDYFIKRKSVRRESSVEPIYLDKNTFDAGNRFLQRTSKATIEFREGTESVIKTICCIPKC